MKRQNLIEECGGSKLIISIFQEDHTSLASKINLLNETLLLGIAYLYNGNATCQNSVLLALKKDNHNFMLSNIRKLVITLG